VTDEELEHVVLGAKPAVAVAVDTIAAEISEPERVAESEHIDLTSPNRYFSKNVIHGEPLHGCAFNGALTMSAQIKDAVILAHAPKSCAYISYQTMSSTGRRRLFERGALLPSSVSPNIDSTDMGEAEMIFGGMERLTEKIAEIKLRKPRAIVVVSACPAGIIGDDIDAARDLGDTDTPVFTLRTDGNMSGDYLQGMLMCYTELARQMIRRDEPVREDTVNIVFEKVVAKNTPDNFAMVETWLRRLGVTVGCRFLCETDCESLINFTAAPLNLSAFKDYTGKLLEDFFTREYGSNFFGMAFPIGFDETRDWLVGVGEFFGKREIAQTIIDESAERYAREIAALRRVMSGKRLMILTYNHELDWIIGAAIDAGIEIVKIGVLDYSQDEGFRTRLKLPLHVESDYDPERRAEDVKKYAPDILLTNYTSTAAGEVALADTIPMCPDVGFFTGLDMVKRWAGLLKMDVRGEWERDERLFRKYYA
jgi:nitrogenase molybdenum-iron protein alpha/beta subunit